MLKTFKESRLHSNKHKPKIKLEPDKTKSNLTPNLKSNKQKIPSGNGFIQYK